METNELINNVKNGDDKSFEQLLDMHHNMIYKIIYSLELKKGDYLVDIESLYQEGCLALYNAVFSFEIGKEMNFSSYAYMVIRARLHTYIRDIYRKNDSEYYSIDNPENAGISNRNLVCDSPLIYHREQDFQARLNDFLSRLNKEDQEIFRMRSDNCSYKQISDRLNVKVKRVDNRLRSLRTKLKKYLKQE